MFADLRLFNRDGTGENRKRGQVFLISWRLSSPFVGAVLLRLLKMIILSQRAGSLALWFSN